MKLRSVLPGGHGRWLRVRRGAAMVAAVSVAMLGGIAVTATSASAGGETTHQVWVCKYVGKPYVDEVLKRGKQPILVAYQSTAPAPGWVGAPFSDAQHSYVIAVQSDANTDQGNNYNGSDGECPAGRTVTPPVIHAPTCDAPGTVDFINTDFYTFVRSGPDSAAMYAAMHGDTTLATFGPYDLRQLSAEECASSVPVTPPTFTAGTCAAAGSLVLPASRFYHWEPSGPETARMVTAVSANEGITLTGTKVFGPFDLTKLAKLDSQSAACRQPPPPPADAPAISLVKVATVVETDADDGVANSGESILYTFNVTNIGNVALSDVTVIDAIVAVGTVTCPATTLAVGATFTCTAAAFPVTDLNATGANIVNGATASGQPPRGGRVSVTAFATTPTAVVVGEVVTVAPGNVPAIVPVKVVKGAVVTKATVSPAKVTALAFTGAETVPLGLSGLLALLLGAGLVAIARRQGRRANN